MSGRFFKAVSVHVGRSVFTLDTGSDFGCLGLVGLKIMESITVSADGSHETGGQVIRFKEERSCDNDNLSSVGKDVTMFEFLYQTLLTEELENAFNNSGIE